MIDGLEVVPRKTVEYRGSSFEEMDLDAVLARHPQVALVDELAHTNVPGSGPQRETLAGRHRPSSMPESTSSRRSTSSTSRASPTPWSGSPRCRSANGCPTGWSARPTRSNWSTPHPSSSGAGWSTATSIRPSKVDQALSHFFRTDNLTALRELALRFLADETEEELLDHLRDQRKDVVWETNERILVGVTTAPGTEAIVRRASRMASRIKADLQVLHVVATDKPPRFPDDRLIALRQLSADVGAEWSELRSDDPAQALIDFARRHHVTQIVVGSSQRSRWQELMGGGSIVRKIARLAAPAAIDVHIIARRGEAPEFAHTTPAADES